MRARGLRTAVAAVAVAAALLLVAGCGGRDVDGRLVTDPGPSSPSSASSPASAPSASGTPTPQATGAQAADQPLVDVLGMRVADFASGYTLEEPSLSSSLDVATLDHCGATFPSEADRTARRSLVLVAPDGQRMGVLSEAVAYTSEEAAARALDELATAVSGCADGTPVRLAGIDVVLRDDLPGTVPTDGLVPEADRVVVGARYESGDGTVVLRTLALWQRQGRGVVELLLTHTDEPFSDADLARLGGLGAKVAGHLEEQADALR